MTGFLEKAYAHKSGDEAKEFYDAWADTYEAELRKNGYATPFRCAEALAERTLDFSKPVLDIGCGTGLSGLALRGAGFSVIDGVDPSREMMKYAKEKNVYRDIRLIHAAAPLKEDRGIYTNAVAAGVLSPGLAPPEALDQIFEFLPTDGRLAFSLNDHAISEGAHEGRLNELIDAGMVELEFKEYGDHLPSTDMGSYVYVLRKR